MFGLIYPLICFVINLILLLLLLLLPPLVIDCYCYCCYCCCSPTLGAATAVSNTLGDGAASAISSLFAGVNIVVSY